MVLAPAVLVCLGLGLAQGRPSASASAQAPQLQTTGFSSFDPNTGTYTVGTNTNLYQVELSDFDNIWRRCLQCSFMYAFRQILCSFMYTFRQILSIFCQKRSSMTGSFKDLW